MIISEKSCDLKTLEERVWRQKYKSVAIRNLFGGNDKIVLSALINAKHLTLYNDTMRGKLFEKEM